jgi:folate-binding protein YgfZ
MSHPSLFHLRRALVSVTGPDRVRFLNGQLTQNIRSLPADRALPACVTDAKGHLHSEIWIASTPDALWLDTAPESGTALIARLEKYAIADDVTFTLAEDSCLLHSLAPLDSHPLLASFSTLAAPRLGVPGWDLRLPVEIWEKLAPSLGEELGSDQEWEVLRIMNGVPAWGKELDPKVLPPEAGLDRTHIDYHKGCYIGQEILSRLKSVGRVQRKLVRWKWDSPTLPQPGTLILAKPQNGSSFEEAGRITSAAFTEAGPRGLGYLKVSLSNSTFQLSSGEEIVPILET